MTTIYDISPPITPALAVFPGDTPPSREVLLDMQRGDHLTLSTLKATVHLGSHVDAPSHYGADAPTMDEVPLERFIGPCDVMDVAARAGERITPDMLPRAATTSRVLLRTGTYPDPEHWGDYAGLAPETVDTLADAGVQLIGVDTPSVDLADAKELIAHHRCLARDVLILEGIVLREVPEGTYELIALPLRLAGFDASPVRAILRST